MSFKRGKSDQSKMKNPKIRLTGRSKSGKYHGYWVVSDGAEHPSSQGYSRWVLNQWMEWAHYMASGDISGDIEANYEIRPVD
jgi:hypothetical protein